MVSLYEIFHTAPAIKDFATDELEKIAETLSIRNRKMNITGILHYHDREFYQILEGDKNVLTNLIDNIEDPTKHGNIHIVWEGKSSARAFNNWGLCPFITGEKISQELVAESTDHMSTGLQLFKELIPVFQV
jgi:hypothetical protein